MTTNSIGGKAAKESTLNKGVSFFVAPHNLSFNKRAIRATEENHIKVMDDLNLILSKH